MRKTRLPLVMLLVLAALLLLNGCAGAAPTPAEVMREAGEQVAQELAAQPVVLSATPTPTPTPTPEPTATPTPTPTPTETPTPTPEIVWTTEEILEALGVDPELLQYALPITTLDTDPQGKTPEQLAEELLSIKGEWEDPAKKFPRDSYFLFMNRWLSRIMSKVFNSPYEYENFVRVGKVTEENQLFAQKWQQIILQEYSSVTTNIFQPQYLLLPEEIAQQYKQMGVIKLYKEAYKF